jgi:NAD(P)-dependent dehydrogenase (short-subunit alcohol dehydrogenase family)
VLLENRNAIVYGAGGIGRAVARAFAREGATVHLAGRTVDRVEAVADEIRAAGGRVETAQLDDIGNVAVFAASDLARTMTATALDTTCGAILT